jgi:hypothetical protein
VHTREGSATVSLTGAGSRAVEYRETGYAVVGADGFGSATITVYFTMLGEIYTGRIGAGLTGSRPAESGHVGDTVAGLYEQPEQPEQGALALVVGGAIEEEVTE